MREGDARGDVGGAAGRHVGAEHRHQRRREATITTALHAMHGQSVAPTHQLLRRRCLVVHVPHLCAQPLPHHDDAKCGQPAAYHTRHIDRVRVARCRWLWRELYWWWRCVAGVRVLTGRLRKSVGRGGGELRRRAEHPRATADVWTAQRGDTGRWRDAWATR
jgi:hypothetical protein